MIKTRQLIFLTLLAVYQDIVDTLYQDIVDTYVLFLMFDLWHSC